MLKMFCFKSEVPKVGGVDPWGSWNEKKKETDRNANFLFSYNFTIQ